MNPIAASTAAATPALPQAVMAVSTEISIPLDACALRAPTLFRKSCSCGVAALMPCSPASNPKQTQHKCCNTCCKHTKPNCCVLTLLLTVLMPCPPGDIAAELAAQLLMAEPGALCISQPGQQLSVPSIPFQQHLLHPDRHLHASEGRVLGTEPGCACLDTIRSLLWPRCGEHIRFRMSLREQECLTTLDRENAPSQDYCRAHNQPPRVPCKDWPKAPKQGPNPCQNCLGSKRDVE